VNCRFWELFPNSEALEHIVVEKSFAGPVGLDPFAVDHELRDSAFSGPADDFFGGAGHGLDIDFAIRDFEAFKKALGLPAVGAPGGAVDDDVHRPHYTRSSSCKVISF